MPAGQMLYAGLPLGDRRAVGTPRTAISGKIDKRPYTDLGIADNRIRFNSLRMIWERRQGIATRIPVQSLSMEQPLLALLTLASGRATRIPVPAELGHGALCAAALPLVPGRGGRTEIVAAGSPAQPVIL